MILVIHVLVSVPTATSQKTHACVHMHVCARTHAHVHTGRTTNEIHLPVSANESKKSRSPPATQIGAFPGKCNSPSLKLRQTSIDGVGISCKARMSSPHVGHPRGSASSRLAWARHTEPGKATCGSVLTKISHVLSRKTSQLLRAYRY